MINADPIGVLVIDDEQLIRDDIAQVLAPKSRDVLVHMDAAGAALSGKAPNTGLPRSSVIPVFKVDKAANGREGAGMVARALEAGEPYAVIFLDVRMPGWDGLETAREIRKHDTRAEIIFVTAYSDHTIEDILSQAGQHVGYHCKPYVPEEIVAQATHAAAEYYRMRGMAELVKAVAGLADCSSPEQLLNVILEQVVKMTGAENALLVKKVEGRVYERILSLLPPGDGLLENIDIPFDVIRREEVLSDIPMRLFVHLQPYTVVLVTAERNRIGEDDRYLLRLFAGHAAQAIRNAELQQILLREEKLSTIGKAIAMVVHDLRTPVKSLKMLVEQVRKDKAQQDDWLDIMSNYADQASAIFDDMMDFVQEQPADKIPVDIRTIAIETAGHIQSLHNGAIAVQLQIPEGLQIWGDPDKLRRIMANLMNNAAEALILHRAMSPCITISATRAGTAGEAELVISDNGPGIPNGIFSSLFEPFVTSGKRKGTGLGLAIVRQYVIAHGATITAVNDKGAKFTIKGMKLANG